MLTEGGEATWLNLISACSEQSLQQNQYKPQLFVSLLEFCLITKFANLDQLLGNDTIVIMHEGLVGGGVWRYTPTTYLIKCYPCTPFPLPLLHNHIKAKSSPFFFILFILLHLHFSSLSNFRL